MENTFETMEIQYPCLITVDKGSVTPRLPSYNRSVQFKDHDYRFITFNDVEDQDETHYGLKGSPTQVERMFNPDRNTDKVVFDGSDEELAQKLKNILAEKKYL